MQTTKGNRKVEKWPAYCLHIQHYDVNKLMRSKQKDILKKKKADFIGLISICSERKRFKRFFPGFRALYQQKDSQFNSMTVQTASKCVFSFQNV